MKPSKFERNIVVVLFVLVFITFSLAQEDSKKMDQFHASGVSVATKFLASFNNTPGK